MSWQSHALNPANMLSPLKSLIHCHDEETTNDQAYSHKRNCGGCKRKRCFRPKISKNHAHGSHTWGAWFIHAS